jgi:hypothetical protein
MHIVFFLLVSALCFSTSKTSLLRTMVLLSLGLPPPHLGYSKALNSFWMPGLLSIERNTQITDACPEKQTVNEHMVLLASSNMDVPLALWGER